MTSPATSRVPPWLLLLPHVSSFVLAAWALPHQPERVPVHWNAAGEPDRWGNPVEALFTLPLSFLAISLVLLAVSRSQATPQPMLRAAVLGLGFLAFGDVAAQAFEWNSFRVTMGALGVLFMLMGPALMASDPATLNGPRLSPAAQRRAGQAWMAVGAVVVLASLLAPTNVWITFTLVAGVISMLAVTVLGSRHVQDKA